MPATPTRIISLKPRDATPLDGIPDLFGARVLCFGLALPCVVLAIGIPIGLAIYPPDGMTALPTMLFLILIGLLGLSAVLLVRAGLRVGAWFHVDGTGFRYGEGPAREQSTSAAEIRIGWNEVAVKPDLIHDVRISSMGPQALSPDLVFWRRLPTGELTEHHLPLRLSGNILSCLRYRNHHELLCAVLQGLAARPGLRFRADVFVDAGIDPVSWQPMKRPSRALWFSVCATAGLVLWFTGTVGLGWSPGKLAIATVLIMAACVVFTVGAWRRAYPDLTGVIAFRAED